MTNTLLVLLFLGTFLLIIIAMLEDIDQAIDDAELDELWDETCTGCGRHYVKPECPVHDPEQRKVAV